MDAVHLIENGIEELLNSLQEIAGRRRAAEQTVKELNDIENKLQGGINFARSLAQQLKGATTAPPATTGDEIKTA